MRPITAVLLTATATTVSALSFPTLWQQKTPAHLRSNLQHPLSEEKPQMSTPPAGDSGTTNSDSGPCISDILPQTRRVNIFASLTRDITKISNRLDDPSQQTTLLAPLNSAIQSLSHKPWEDVGEMQALASGSAETYALGAGEERAQRNLERFVGRHVVPVHPWAGGEKKGIETLAGNKIWWEETDGERFVVSGGSRVKVVSVETRAENGEVWILDGVLGGN